MNVFSSEKYSFFKALVSTSFLFLTFIPNPPARLGLGITQLVEGVVDGFYLHGDFQIGLLLLLVDVVLVMKDFLHVQSLWCHFGILKI